jgi:cytochrome P450
VSADARADDPFEAFNRAQGVGSVRDPYPGYAARRREAPVRRITRDDLPEIMRGQGRVLFTGMAPALFEVLSHDAVSEALLDGERFSSRFYDRTMGLVMGRSILGMDEPEHGAHRGLIQQAFTRRSLERWEREVVRPVVDARIDGFAARGRADLVRELTFPFPVAVIAHMIGVDPADHADFHRWAVELISLGIDPARGVAASQKLRELFARELAERRRAPREDLISLLGRAALDGARLDDEAIFAFLRLLAPAGAETTYRSSSNLFFALLAHPAQLAILRRDRSLVRAAIEEGLRWECPIHLILRVATRDTALAGVAIPEGALLLVNLAAANRDETRHPRPDDFDVFRPPRPHLAFAFGPHRCLGMHLARMESRVVLEAVLDRLPNLRLDPEAKDPHISGQMFRSPLALPVLFDPP